MPSQPMMPSTVDSQGQSYIHQRDVYTEVLFTEKVDQVVTDKRGLHSGRAMRHCCTLL
jgi:hypothetical protein